MWAEFTARRTSAVLTTGGLIPRPCADPTCVLKAPTAQQSSATLMGYGSVRTVAHGSHMFRRSNPEAAAHRVRVSR